MGQLLRRSKLAQILGVATVLGVFSALQAFNYVSFFAEQEQPFRILLALNAFYWYSWAALVPAIFWLARRYRLDRGMWTRSVVAHIVGVFAFTFAHAVLWVAARVLIMWWLADQEVEWWLVVRERYFLYFDWEMMTYWAVVGLSHALDFHRESQERAVAAAQLETRLAEARLQALQRQLHPHFLFNTLHAISALMHRDVEAADAMLARLSDLLRLTLDRVGSQLVPLKDEIDFVQKYLEIEQARFGDRLHIDVDVEPVALDASVPNFVLQPLVENAVRHGVGPKVAGGRIDISARRSGDRLLLVVRDNGVGVKADTLHSFNRGVGLSNTRSRLEHLYRHDHRFEFHAPAGGGLAVTVDIPFVVDTGTRAAQRSVA
jgi:signal transduction histidine kinase